MKNKCDNLSKVINNETKRLWNLNRRFCTKCGKRQAEYGRSICVHCMMKIIAEKGGKRF